MSTSKTLKTLVVVSIIGDVVAHLTSLGSDFALAVTQGAIGTLLLIDVYKKWRDDT